MVEIDARDDGDVGVDDVHRVEPSAQAHFEHARCEVGAAKSHKCGERAVLEVRQRDVRARVLDRVERRDERVVGYAARRRIRTRSL